MTKGTSETGLFLLKYRITFQTSMEVNPAQLLMGRKLWIHLDLMCLRKEEEIQRKQIVQKGNHDFIAKDRYLRVQVHVYTKSFNTSQHIWSLCSVRAQMGTLPFMTGLPEGKVIRQHQDNICRRADVQE